MGLFFLFWILGGLIQLLFIGFVVYFVARLIRGKHPSAPEEKKWYLQVFFSREDLVGQIFFLLSLPFLGITLTTFNRDLGEPLSWQTILLLTSVIAVLVAYFFRILYALPLGLFGLISWWGTKATEWAGRGEIKPIATFVGLFFLSLLLYVLGNVHKEELKFKRFSFVYLTTGLVFVTGTLFFLSTNQGLKFFSGITEGIPFVNSWQITLSLVLFVMAFVVALAYALNYRLIALPETLVLLFLLLLFGLFTLLPEQKLFISQARASSVFSGGELSFVGVLWAVFFNVLIFLELLGMILLGYRRREEWLINLGVIFLFLFVFVKYFDWFFTFLDKSIFFVSAGLLFLLIGWLMEKGRRYMILAIKSQPEKVEPTL